MERFDAIVVGAGPAGSTCAGRLSAAGANVLLLDRTAFPRTKLCAGWLPPRVFSTLGVTPQEYPFSLTAFAGLSVRLRGVPLYLPGRQYAIRRVEFDDWLVTRSGVPLTVHEVRSIEKASGRYIVDGQFSSDTIIGAGGAWCPVYRALFRETRPRKPGSAIVAIEEEFPAKVRDGRCRLRFFDDGLPGYAWYVPKAGGYCNVGIGAMRDTLADRGDSIRRHWKNFIGRLERRGLIQDHVWKPSGYVYHLRQPPPETITGNGPRAYLAGDALGLATFDMGEGIGQAIESGARVADAIISGSAYSTEGIPEYSLFSGFFRRVNGAIATNIFDSK